MTVFHPQTSNIVIEIRAIVWLFFSNLFNDLLVHIHRQNCIPVENYTRDVPPSQDHIEALVHCSCAEF